jgi:hypothetical protein
MKGLFNFCASLALTLSLCAAAENAVLIDIKSPWKEKTAIEPAMMALRHAIADHGRLKTVAFGADWQIWLSHYRRIDQGTSSRVQVRISIVHPSAPGVESASSSSILSYEFDKEPRDVLTTEDSFARFMRGKINDKSKEFQAEAIAAYPALQSALRGLTSAMGDSELQRSKNMRFRSQDL